MEDDLPVGMARCVDGLETPAGHGDGVTVAQHLHVNRRGQRLLAELLLLPLDDGADVGRRAGLAQIAGQVLAPLAILHPGDRGYLPLARRHEDRGARLLLQAAGHANVVRVHVGDDDTPHLRRGDAQCSKGGLPAAVNLGAVEPGVDHRPAVTVAQQVAVDVVERKGQRQPHLVNIGGYFTHRLVDRAGHRHPFVCVMPARNPAGALFFYPTVPPFPKWRTTGLRLSSSVHPALNCPACLCYTFSCLAASHGRAGDSSRLNVSD